MNAKFISKHIHYLEDGQVERLLCRECGETIYDWIDFGETETTVNGKTVVRVRQRPMKLDNYTKLNFQMNDKSFYTPPWCTECADNREDDGFSDEELEAVYLVELDAWREGLLHQGDSRGVQAFLGSMGNKHIVRFLGKART